MSMEQKYIIGDLCLYGDTVIKIIEIGGRYCEYIEDTTGEVYTNAYRTLEANSYYSKNSLD